MVIVDFEGKLMPLHWRLTLECRVFHSEYRFLTDHCESHNRTSATKTMYRPDADEWKARFGTVTRKKGIGLCAPPRPIPPPPPFAVPPLTINL